MHSPNLPSSNISLPPTSQPPPLLNRKHKRTVYSFIISSHKGNRCSICLEYDKYSISKCINCKKCNSSCHIECYERECSVISDKNDFICNKCSCKCNDTYQKCCLCSDDIGIVVQIKQTNQWSHLYCKRFYKEIIDHEASLANSAVDTHNIPLRKWIYKNSFLFLWFCIINMSKRRCSIINTSSNPCIYYF